MKKLCLVVLVVTLCACVSALAEPVQNGAFNVPEIGAITIDGNLSDWSYSTPWSEPFILWNTLAGDVPMASTTKAKFAWNDAADLLYVAFQTDQDDGQGHGGGHAVIGVGITLNDVPTSAVGATQLAFDPGAGTSVAIMNEIQFYNDKYTLGWASGGTDGVVAAQTHADGIWTYEIAVPYWQNWVTMDTKQSISVNDVYYVYMVMENKLEGATGTDMTYEGNPAFYNGAFDDAAALTFRGAPKPGDANIDGKVDALDAEALAANWLAGNADWAMGDFSGDNVVDDVDAAMMAANWHYGVSPNAAVPEPSALIMLMLGCFMLLIRFSDYRRIGMIQPQKHG